MQVNLERGTHFQEDGGHWEVDVENLNLRISIVHRIKSRFKKWSRNALPKWFMEHSLFLIVYRVLVYCKNKFRKLGWFKQVRHDFLLQDLSESLTQSHCDIPNILIVCKLYISDHRDPFYKCLWNLPELLVECTKSGKSRNIITLQFNIWFRHQS